MKTLKKSVDVSKVREGLANVRKVGGSYSPDAVAKLCSHIDTLEAEVARLREVLYPLGLIAECVDCTSGAHNYSDEDTWEVPLGMLRSARQATGPKLVTPLSAQEDVVERAADVIEAFYQKRRNIGYSSHEIAVALSDAGLLSTERERGLEEVWSSDWTKAPKNEKLFLVKYPNGNVTTAYFYWYVEDEIESFKRVEFWALQDANIDMPIDDNGPPEDQGLMWRPML